MSSNTPSTEDEEELLLEPQPVQTLRKQHPATTIDYTVRHLSGEPHIIITASNPTCRSIVTRQESGGFEVQTPKGEIKYEYEKKDALTTATTKIAEKLT